MASKIIQHRVGGWLPRDHRVLEAWLAKQIAKVNDPIYKDKKFSPVIQEFQNLIEDDPEIWMGFHQMFEQVPKKPPYNDDPIGQPQVSSDSSNHYSANSSSLSRFGTT
jgi:phosphatidylserine decarboxylase